MLKMPILNGLVFGKVEKHLSLEKKNIKLLFKKQRYILSGKPKEDGNEVSDCNKKVIYQFHHFLQKKKENGSVF